MQFVADHDPMRAEDLERFVDDGRFLVAEDSGGTVAGYLVLEVADGRAHIEQVSVDDDHQGGGIGRALVEEAESWALSQSMDAVTLTTFKDVAWNRPLYEHLGYTVIADEELGPELNAIRGHEAESGLDPATRVCMIKWLSRTRSG